MNKKPQTAENWNYAVSIDCLQFACISVYASNIENQDSSNWHSTEIREIKSKYQKKQQQKKRLMKVFQVISENSFSISVYWNCVGSLRNVPHQNILWSIKRIAEMLDIVNTGK